MGHDRARWGSVTFVPRFGSSLNLNPHVHVLMLDGVYVDGEDASGFRSRPGSISYATTGSWRPGPGPASASWRPSRLPSRRRRTAMRALRPAAIGGAGRPCWRGCFPPTSAECAACGGRLRIIAARTDPASIRCYLTAVGFAGPAPGVGPLPGPRRSRRSSSPPDLPSRPVAVAGAYGGGVPSTVPQAPD